MTSHSPEVMQMARACEPIPNAVSRRQISAFAKELLALPNTAHPAMAARILAEGLMTPRGFGAWVLTISAKLIHWRRGGDLYSAYAALLCQPKGWEVATDTVRQTVDWMLNGRDATNAASVGGFNQPEIDKLFCVYALVTDALERRTFSHIPPIAAEKDDG